MTAPAQIKASFPVRRMDFGFTDIERHWFHHDAFLTHFLTNLSSLFPEGEMFFVDSVRAVRNDIDDPVMQKEISAFIGQEAMHSKEHKTFNDFATAQGLDVEYLHQRVGKLLGVGKKVLSKQQQLAITCALEHFTATVAAQLLRREDWNGRMNNPTMRNLWLWHAIEESEHKAVAYDVYQKTGGGYVTRATWMVLASAILAAVAADQQVRLMKQDGELFNLKSWGKGLWNLFGYKGFMSELTLQYLDYFRPGFHPNDHDSEALEKKYKAYLALKD